MSEGVVSTHSVLVGPEVVDVVLNLGGSYTLYLDVGGTAYEVLAVGATPNVFAVIVSPTAVPTLNLDWCIKVLPNYLKKGEKFGIYGIKAASTTAREFVPAEVR